MRFSILKTILIIFVISHYSFSQESPQAELVDKFGEITGEDYIARLDNLLNILTNNPKSKGYVVIENPTSEKLTGRKRNLGIRYEQMGKGHFKARANLDNVKNKFNENNVNFIRAVAGENFKISLWVIPENAEKPDFNEVKWDFKTLSDIKPFIFTTSDLHNQSMFYSPEYLGLNLFVEYLESNPTSRGNFVINALSKRQYNKERLKIKKILVEKYKVDTKRINFFYVQVKKVTRRFPVDYYPQVEVWFLPKSILKK